MVKLITALVFALTLASLAQAYELKVSHSLTECSPTERGSLNVVFQENIDYFLSQEDHVRFHEITLPETQKVIGISVAFANKIDQSDVIEVPFIFLDSEVARSQIDSLKTSLEGGKVLVISQSLFYKRKENFPARSCFDENFKYYSRNVELDFSSYKDEFEGVEVVGTTGPTGTNISLGFRVEERHLTVPENPYNLETTTQDSEVSTPEIEPEPMPEPPPPLPPEPGGDISAG